MTYSFPRRIKQALAIFLCAALFLPLFGCSSSKKPTKNSFTYGLESSVKSLDPQTASGKSASIIIGSLFEGLCRLDSSNKPIPGVARAWISDADCTQYVFLLRDDVQWSNGEPVTAHDFVFAMQRALAPETKSSNIDELFILKNARDVHAGLKSVEELGVKAEGDFILSVTLEYSDPNFPAATASTRYMPCNEKFFNETSGRYGLEAGYLLTNGPFEFASDYSWDSLSVGLIRNSDYHETVLPAELTFLLNTSGTPDSLLAGEQDLICTDKSTASKLSQEGCSIYSFESGTTGLLLNTRDEFLQNADLRELFVKTIDRSSLLRDLPDGVEEAGDIMPSCVMWGTKPYSEAAQRGLIVAQDESVTNKISSIAEELETDTIPALTVICPDDSLSIDLVNRMIASWNEKIGSYFNILPLDAETYQQHLASGDYQMALYTVNSTGTSPFSFLRAFESTASPQLLDSPTYDTLLHSAEKTVEDYSGLEKMLNNQFIFYPITKSNTYYAAAPSVTGLSVNMNGIDFTNADK